MNHKSPSRTRSHTPSCPEDPDEKDIRRKTISQIQQDVERELENADKILQSTLDSFSGSRTNSRTGNVRIKGDSIRKNVKADSGAADGCRASGQIRSNTGLNDLGARTEEHSRISIIGQVATSGASRAINYDTFNRPDERPNGPHGQYSEHEGTGTPGGRSKGPSGSYGSYERAGSGRGGSGAPDNSYERAGSRYGSSGPTYNSYERAGSGHGGSGSPHSSSYERAESGHGGSGAPDNSYERAGSRYGSSGAHDNSYERAESRYGGSGAPYSSYERVGSGHKEPNDPYGNYERGSYERSSEAYGGSGAPEGSYKRPGEPSDIYGGSSRAGSSYSKQGGPGDLYGSTGAAAVSHGLLEAHSRDGDSYSTAKDSRSPGSTVRTRDTSKMSYDQGRTASSIPLDAVRSAAQNSRGRSPPSVHYSPSTALSPLVASPARIRTSEPRSETTFNSAANRSPTGTQYFDSIAQSQAGLDSSNPDSHERGASLMGTQYLGSKNQSDLMEAVADIVGEGSGNLTSPTGGSRNSSRSTRGNTATDGSREAFVTGIKDQSFANTKICPAAVQGKCPAFARDSSAMEQSRASSNCSSANKRPLSRIEEGPSSEEVSENEAYGKLSSLQKEDFTPPSGGIRSQMQSAREGCATYSSRVPVRPRCEGRGQLMYNSMVKDGFQSIAPRNQAIEQPLMHSRVSISSPEHHHHDHHDQHDHHNHHDHHDPDHAHDHDGEGFHGKPMHQRDEKTTSALNHLSQLQTTPSYFRCKLDRELDFSSCEKSTKEPFKMTKFPEKPCKEMDELHEMINCETEDVDAVWYLTSDEKKTYKKPCPKQQKAQENVKSILKPHIFQSCAKEYPPLEHPDPDDITPELAASVMFSQERGVKLNECPDETIKRFFPDTPRPPFPEKSNTVHIVDSNQEDQEEIIEKSASVPSEGVSDSAYTRTMQNKGDVGAQKSYDIDFAIGAEKREYVLVAEKPQRYNKVQFRGNLPSWFPGYMQAFPADKNGIKLAASPSGLFREAWTNTNPENLPSSDVVVLE